MADQHHLRVANASQLVDVNERRTNIESHVLRVQDCIVPINSGSKFKALWRAYCSFVKENYDTLVLGEEAITRLLFWAPHADNDRWREMLYGLLSVHQMTTDLAMQTSDMQTEAGEERDNNVIPMTLRVVLTMLHGLSPTLLELTCRGAQEHHRMRLSVERIKFLLRLCILASQWQRLYKSTDGQEHIPMVGSMLREGGMLFGTDKRANTMMTTDHAQFRRQEYIGRRTLRRVAAPGPLIASPKLRNKLLMMGELLHIIRPLYWASIQQRHGNSDSLKWKPWMVALGMELFSLRCISLGTMSGDTREMNRRKLRLLLFLLRTPAWEKVSHPLVNRLLGTLRRVPVLGAMSETYIMDLLLYWKHPFFLEQD